jgi:hypothetical protein
MAFQRGYIWENWGITASFKKESGVLLEFVFRERSSAVIYVPYPGGSGALASADERLTKIV